MPRPGAAPARRHQPRSAPHPSGVWKVSCRRGATPPAPPPRGYAPQGQGCKAAHARSRGRLLSRGPVAAAPRSPTARALRSRERPSTARTPRAGRLLGLNLVDRMSILSLRALLRLFWWFGFGFARPRLGVAPAHRRRPSVDATGAATRVDRSGLRAGEVERGQPLMLTLRRRRGSFPSAVGEGPVSSRSVRGVAGQGCGCSSWPELPQAGFERFRGFQGAPRSPFRLF